MYRIDKNILVLTKQLIKRRKEEGKERDRLKRPDSTHILLKKKLSFFLLLSGVTMTVGNNRIITE